MATDPKQAALEAAVAQIDAHFQRPKPADGAPGAKAYAAHLASEARVETARRKHAAAITRAEGYNPDLGAIVHPTDTVNFLADMLEQSGVPVVREAYGFRTMTAAEKAVAAQAKCAA